MQWSGEEEEMEIGVADRRHAGKEIERKRTCIHITLKCLGGFVIDYFSTYFFLSLSVVIFIDSFIYLSFFLIYLRDNHGLMCVFCDIFIYQSLMLFIQSFIHSKMPIFFEGTMLFLYLRCVNY